MSDAFGDALDVVLRHEGGYQNMRDDSGNWTGGKIGAGELRGTKAGISAASYPTLDIRNLTEPEIASIYWRDYWDPMDLDRFAPALATKLLDAAVVLGQRPAIKCLQRALRACGYRAIEDDGVIGQETLGASQGADAPALLAAFREAIADRHRMIAEMQPGKAEFLSGWLKRAYDEV
jgi:lysozyme family protein